MGLFSSIFSPGSDAKRAADVAAQAQTNAAANIKNQYDTTAANYQPYMDAGTAAMGSFQDVAAGLPGQFNPILGQMGDTVNSMQPIIGQLTSTNLNDYQQSPGYDFRMQQGIKAIQNSAAANGTLNSGSTLKALEEYGQNYGTNDYQIYLQNLQNQLGAINTQLGAQGGYLGSTINAANAEMQPYGTLMTQGANMTQGLGQLGGDAAKQAAGYQAGAGATQAAGMMAQSNALQQAGQQWIQLGAMAAGGAMGGMGMGGGAGGMSGAFTGAQTGAQFGQLLNGQAPASQTPFQGYGYQPYTQPTQAQAQIQPMQYLPQAMIAAQAPTAQYNGANMYNPTQGMQQSIGKAY